MKTFKKLFEYAQEKKGYMILSLILSAVATILSFVPYYYFWQILREITGEADISQIRQISFTILGTTLFYILAYLGSLLCSHIFAFRLESNMRKRGLKHLLNASFSFFDVNPSGRTRKIIDDNASNTHTIIAHMLPDSINAVLFPICLLIMSFIADVYIGILVVIATAFSLMCFKFMYVGNDMMKEYMEALEDINSETVEYVRGIQVIKVFGLVLESFKRLHKAIVKYSEVINRQCQTCRIPFVMFQCGMMSFGAFIILIAFHEIDLNSPAGEVVSLVVFFMTFAGLLHAAFMKIMLFNKNYSLGKDAVDKLENLFVEMDRNKLFGGTVENMKDCNIEFDNVSFEYEEGVHVLKNFSLKLEAGKKYALVGSSGSGKSTIAKLISGFYPITGGSLKIGGVDVKDYKEKTLEKSIAFVFQNAKLFKTSIYENVRIGNSESTCEEIMKALEMAMCDSIIEKFPDREHTVIGEKGVHLSGGEIQRIALARAILKNAPIIILDEVSAASDPENEYEMQQAFSKLMEDKTVIMIAHRLSSIRNVDEILVISDGEVVERGCHSELMARETKYKSFQELFYRANEWRLENEI